MKNKLVVFMSAMAILMSTVAISSTTASAASGTNVPSDFDASFYADTYPDLKEAIGTDAEALYNHYVQFGQKEGRLPNAQGKLSSASSSTTATGNSTSVSNNNSSFYVADDVNYLRASYLSNWGSYTIGQVDKWGNGDPAVGFTRQDYSSDPFYISLRSELEAFIKEAGKTIHASYYSRSTCYIGNSDDSKYYHNLVNNLHVDLLKSGILSNGVFMIIPADGMAHINAYGLDYNVSVFINDHTLDKADIAAHPEIKGYYNKESLSGE